MKLIEQSAFIEAYCQNGEASEDYVTDFIERWVADKDIPYDEYYTGIRDALSIWSSAIKFAQQQKESA